MNTPKMVPGEVEMVSVEWILQNATHSVDGFEDGPDGLDYEEMMFDKSGDRQFPALLTAIMTQGFRVPIVMLFNYYDQPLTHGNGHHRFIAALLLGLDTIPVYWSDYEEDLDYMCVEKSATMEIAPLEPLVNGFSFGYDLTWPSWT